MPDKHALLSASSAYRWLECPPSARACADTEERASPYAKEGTDAHSLCEYKLKKALGQDVKNPVEDMDYFNAEMDECTDDYCSFVMEQLEEAKEYCPDPKLMVEVQLDLSRWIPEGFGTGDAVILADSVLHIIDFKYGTGVPVEAEGNPQIRCYALGALDAYDGIYEINTVKTTIFQPRLGNITTVGITKQDLLDWAETVLAPTAKLAFEGKGEFKAGDHCRFCKIKSTCRKRAEYNLELAQYDFKMPDTLTENEIAAILPKADELISWANDVKDYALSQALSGICYDGFKLVEGRSTRKYTSEAAAAAVVENAGYDPYEKKVLGITAMTSMLGRKKFNELLGGLVTKPSGKPTLVPVNDRRPEMNTPQNDFKEN